jgi:hypothetical protein
MYLVSHEIVDARHTTILTWKCSRTPTIIIQPHEPGGPTRTELACGRNDPVVDLEVLDIRTSGNHYAHTLATADGGQCRLGTVHTFDLMRTQQTGDTWR